MNAEEILTFGSVRLTVPRIPLLETFTLLLVLSGFVYGQNPRKASQENNSNQIEIEAPEAEVLGAVKAVAEDGTVHGTYEYEREKTLKSAHRTETSSEFGVATDGTVLYKMADNVVDPRHFKGSNGEGAITVRYIVRPVDAGKSTLQVDAIFVEREHHWVHKSDGTVEAAEYAFVRQRLETAQKASSPAPSNPSGAVAATVAPQQPQQGSRLDAVNTPEPVPAPHDQDTTELERQVAELRSEVEARTKDSGVQILSAPYASAPELKTLPAGAAMVILVITPKWYGIETADGQKGWVRRSQLEPVR